MNAIRSAVLATALAAPLAVLAAPAAQKPPGTAPRARPEQRSATPPSAPRATPSAPAPAPEAMPAPGEAPRRAVLLGGTQAWFGGSVGAVSAFDTGKAIALHVDYGILRTPPTWRKLALEWHLTVSLARPAGETGLTATVVPPFGVTPVEVDAGEEKVKAVLFEVVPTARVLWTVTPGVAFFADGGLGVCQTVEQYERSEMFQGRTVRTDYVTGFVARVGVGLAADVAPRWRLVFEPLAFDLQLGPKFSAYTPTLGVAYRL